MKEVTIERNFKRIQEALVSDPVKKRARHMFQVLCRAGLWDFSVFWDEAEGEIEFKYDGWGLTIYDYGD